MDNEQRCGTCKFATQNDALYTWVDCSAPVPDSVNNARIKMEPENVKDCPTWHAK